MLMPSIFGENLFDEFWNDFAKPVKREMKYENSSVAVMRTDIKESAEGYELHIELPGCRKEDVKAELKDGNLTIRATMNIKEDTPAMSSQPEMY